MTSYSSVLSVFTRVFFCPFVCVYLAVDVLRKAIERFLPEDGEYVRALLLVALSTLALCYSGAPCNLFGASSRFFCVHL